MQKGMKPLQTANFAAQAISRNFTLADCFNELCERIIFYYAMCDEKYCLQKNDRIGRYISTTKRISPGEVIITENPHLVLPQWESELLCTACFRDSNIICRRCGVFPLCLSCTEHDNFECNFFKDIPREKKNFLIDNFQIYSIIKCLLLNECENGKTTYNEILNMESHVESRRDSLVWKIHEAQLYVPIKQYQIDKMFSNCEVTVELVQRIAGIMDINAFEIRGKYGSILRGIYPKCSLLAHDCVANTQISVDMDYQMKVYARMTIEESQTVYYNYTNPLLGTFQRRQQLKDGKCFICECKRCLDPAELGTHLSSITCFGCQACLMVLYKGNWTCPSCKKTREDGSVTHMLVNVLKEIESADGDLEKMELLILKLTIVLNPNHYLVLDLKQKVASLLREIITNSVCKVGAAILKRKLLLCDQILAVLRVVQPGISRLTGIALYEYVTPYIQLAHEGFEKSEISTPVYLDKLKKAESILKESAGMLVYDHPLTPEGKLAKSALAQLKQLRTEITRLSREKTKD